MLRTNQYKIMMEIPNKCQSYTVIDNILQGTDEDVALHLVNDLNQHLEMVTLYTANMEVQSIGIRRELQVCLSPFIIRIYTYMVDNLFFNQSRKVSIFPLLLLQHNISFARLDTSTLVLA